MPLLFGWEFYSAVNHETATGDGGLHRWRFYSAVDKELTRGDGGS
jgi:hypothetical protein